MGVRQQPRKFYRELCGQLIRFAEFQFRLNKQVKDRDGKSIGTRRHFLDLYAKQCKGYSLLQVKRCIEGPKCPAALTHIYRWFLELSNQRDYSDCGPKSIKPSEIYAWSALTNYRPLPHEIRLLLDLDVRFRNIHAEDESDYHNMSDEDKQVVMYVNSAIAMSRKV